MTRRTHGLTLVPWIVAMSVATARPNGSSRKAATTWTAWIAARLVTACCCASMTANWRRSLMAGTGSRSEVRHPLDPCGVRGGAPASEPLAAAHEPRDAASAQDCPGDDARNLRLLAAVLGIGPQSSADREAIHARPVTRVFECRFSATVRVEQRLGLGLVDRTRPSAPPQRGATKPSLRAPRYASTRTRANVDASALCVCG